MSLAPSPGDLEVTIKIRAMPDAAIVENGWKRFVVDVGNNTTVTVTLRPKIFSKLESAAKQWPEWLAKIVGSPTGLTAEGFSLVAPDVQVFERKSSVSKAAVPPPPDAVSVNPTSSE